MTKTLKLTFIYFKEQLYGLFGGLSKKSKSKTLPLVILLVLFLLTCIGYSLYNLGESLNKFGKGENILLVGLLLATFLSLMITISDTQGTMYKSRDYDMLASLPLNSACIISAKYLSTYLISLLYFALAGVPTFVIYFIFNKVTALKIIYCIISLVFLPALGQFVSCVLGWVVNVISSKMRNKNIIRAMLSVILAVGFSVFISLANNNMLNTLFAEDIPLWFNIVFSSIAFLFKAVTTSNFLYFLASVGVSLLFIALGVALISVGYKKINTSLNTTVKGKPKAITYKSQSTVTGLFKKEVATFFNSPVYAVNGLMGLIMSVVIMVMSITMYYQIGTIPEVKNVMTAMMVFGCAMCAGIAPTTSVAVSIEGTKLQTLKSLPVKFKDIVVSKCGLNLVLALPVMAINTIIFGAVLKIDVLLVLLIAGYLIISSLSQTLLGFILNLKFPRLNWTSETQAVKSGASMITTMLLDMLVSLAPMVLFFVLYFNYSWITITGFVGVSLGAQAIYAIALIIVICKKGEKIYNNIQV